MKLGRRTLGRNRWMLAGVAAVLLAGATAHAAPKKLAPAGESAARRGSATETVFARAHAALQRGDRAGALALYEKAVTQDAENPRLWQVVGDLRWSLERAVPAVDAWQRAAKLAPWNGEISERVARGAVKIGDFALATDAQTRVVDVLNSQIESGFTGQRRDLGTGASLGVHDALRRHLGVLSELAVLAGDFTTAEQAARRLIRLAPEAVDGRLALAYVHLHGAEYDDAADLYQEVLAVEPENATALNNLGNIEYMRRDFDRAAALFERILEASDASPYSQSIAMANLGELYQINRAFEPAAEMYRHAIELQPQGAWGYMGLAALLDVSGDYDGAVDTMIDGWERDQNRLTRLNMHFYMDEWSWQRDALIAEIEGDVVLAAKLWRKIADGDVEMLRKSAAWHLRSLASGGR
ncbi:tetratricopeptide repeat protein [Myxococcota bacterium]|nr:tetratricopeptide repeat protein [Myxococcota bacterium]